MLTNKQRKHFEKIQKLKQRLSNGTTSPQDMLDAIRYAGEIEESKQRIKKVKELIQQLNDYDQGEQE